MTRTTRLLCALAATAATACSEEKLCTADQILCGESCTAVSTDPGNCGACGHACAAGEWCTGGTCLCPDGRTSCGGVCADLSSDPAHCGGCGTVCDSALVCTTNDAGTTSCAGACAGTGQTECERACVDLGTNALHCGACGRSCGSNERCAGGRCLADLYLACFNSDEVREATLALSPAGVPISVSSGPGGIAWIGETLFVSSAGPGGAETLAAISFDPPAVRVANILLTDVASPDIQYLAARGGLLWVAHASTGTLLVVDPAGTIVDEIALAPDGASNPNGIAFVGDKAYVALNARSEVVVLDVSGVAACAAGTATPPCTAELARIDVQPLASPTAHAQPSRIAVAGGRAFVTLWNLDDQWSPPAGSTGRLAVIDIVSDTLDETISGGGVTGLLDLGAGCLDPADVAILGDTLFVSCGAFQYDETWTATIIGSGIVPVDLSGTVPVVQPILTMAADEAPGDLAFCAGASYVADRNSGRVFRFDSTGILDASELCPLSNGYAFVSDIACGF
jgi:hypothetical protein